MSHHSSGRRRRHHARQVALLRWVILGLSSLLGFGFLVALIVVGSAQQARPPSLSGTLAVLTLAVLATVFLSGLCLNAARLAATIANVLKLYSGHSELKAAARRHIELRRERMTAPLASR